MRSFHFPALQQKVGQLQDVLQANSTNNGPAERVALVLGH